MQTANDVRAPFVKFEVRAVEDRNQTLTTGKYITKDVDFIILIPHGDSKTVIEQPFDEWRKKVAPHTGAFHASGASSDTPLMAASRFPSAWLEQIDKGYAAWKEGRELPVDGTPLRNWPVLSPAQLKNLEGLNLFTLEQLANATDDAVAALGMGGIALRQRARDFLSAQGGEAAKLSAALESQREESKAKDLRIQSLEERLQALETAKAK